MVAGLGDRDRLALVVAGPDPDRQFELVIELAARAKAGAASSGSLRWPLGRRIGRPEGCNDEARL